MSVSQLRLFREGLDEVDGGDALLGTVIGVSPFARHLRNESTARGALQQSVKWPYVTVRHHRSLVGSLPRVALGHSGRCPPTEPREVNFVTAVTEPIVDEGVSEHVWVEVNPCSSPKSVERLSN